MGKPIKELGIVQFLLKKAPGIAGDVATGLLEVAMGDNPINVVRDRINKAVADQPDLSDMDKAMIDQLLDTELERARIANADRANARNMQIEALKSGGHVAKNFVYYIGGITILMSFVSLILLFFFEVPASNKSIVDMSIGFLFGSGLGTILTYFFGSSSDADKSKSQITDLMEKITTSNGK